MKKICELLNIKYPIIQGGMVWVSGAKLAAACANCDILGLIGAGSMNPILLDQHIKKAKSLTKKSFGVNLPLLYKDIEKQINICLENGINIFFTSAGSPKKYTKFLKDKGCTVVHVTSSPLLAKKCEDAGVDAIVAEGFEAGGHNGRDETTTMCLIPQVRDSVKIPVIAAGGIGSGRSMAAAFCLGADAVQIGSRFAASVESSAHKNFKQAIINASFGDTKLTMKKHVPVRLLMNKFAQDVIALENKGASQEELIEHLGKFRAKSGMLEGKLEEGELEIGQVSASIENILTCEEIVEKIIFEYNQTIKNFNPL